MVQNASDSPLTIDNLDPRDYIIIKGAKVNNLKALSVAIPRNKFVVITGLSGSGKSSLAFDTLYAEGQRMYVESLSSYARQFLGRMEKPEVEYIKGVSPAIAIEQKVSAGNNRSTVGTSTEIYDYLKLLYSRIGKTYSPKSGELVSKDSVTDVVDFILKKEEGAKIQVLAPYILPEGRSLKEGLEILLQQGYSRIAINGEVSFIEDEVENKTLNTINDIAILIDRLAVKKEDEELQFRLSDSIQTAYYEGKGNVIIDILNDKRYSFSERFERDGIVFEEPTPAFFAFNNPYGACKTCDGFGSVLGIDNELVVPDKSLSVFEGAIAPWRGETMKAEWLDPLLEHGIDFDFPIHRPYIDLEPAHRTLLWKGNKYFKGLNRFFKYLESHTHKIQYRVMLSRYRGRTTCPDCRGTRLRKDAQYVKIADKSIADIVLMPLDEASKFFESLKLTGYEEKVAKRLLVEIKSRLGFLEQVGLGYLTLNRLTNTLSGGEFQRIKLATSLGSALVGSMYILDEPSIGLHPKDTNRLIEVLQHLKNLGNTVIVVEHEESIMRAADQIIDIGPEAGTAGGKLIFQGTIEEMARLNGELKSSYTAKYLTGEEKLESKEKVRKWDSSITIRGARQHNLDNCTLQIPLGVMTVVSGVSGSGKSTLVRNIFYPAMQRATGTGNESPGLFDGLEGDIEAISKVEMIDQSPIGKSSRSNPVTYIKAYDAIRDLYANQQLSKTRKYKPKHFSFNVEGGRCDNCKGEGVTKVEMQFMADLYLTCEVCKGKRFKQEVLDVNYQDKSIADVLDMTVDDAISFFEKEKKIINSLIPLQETGLGYIRLGQSSNTLSGGEAQRVKLASFFGKGGSSNDKILFIFDEPTTGLHFHDIKKLLYAMNRLVDEGHTVVVIEHNIDVIKQADWLIDMGPGGGQFGGKIVYQGEVKNIKTTINSYTKDYL